MEALGQRISCAFCLDIFVICHGCYRGQKFCSAVCRAAALKVRRQETVRRYQQSDSGRRRHRLRQNAYRRRKKDVTHPSSQNPVKVLEQTPVKPPRVSRGLDCCWICRRIVRYLLNQPSTRPRTDLRRRKKKHDRHRNGGTSPPTIFR